MNKTSDSSLFMTVNAALIRPNSAFNFDLYIKVNEKFLLYIKKGDDLDEDRLKRIVEIQQKEIDRLFILKSEQSNFDTFVGEEIEETLEDDKLEANEKLNYIKELAISAIECNFEEPESIAAFQLTMKTVKGLTRVVSDNPKALQKIFLKKGRKTNIVETHCANTAALALKLAFACGHRGKDLENLGAAALLHDIGVRNFKQDDIDILFTKPKDRFKNTERLVYADHVHNATQILGSKDFINPQILDLIEKHEEDLGGTGYPAKVSVLSDLQQILNLANRFEKKVSVENLDPVAAFNSLFTSEVGKIDLKYINKLKQVIRAEEMEPRSEFGTEQES